MSNNSASAAAATANNEGAANANSGGSQAAVTFTPEQQKVIDSIVGERVKAAKSTGATEAEAALLKRLGVTKPEDAEAALKNYATLTEAQKSEQQRLVDNNATLQKKLDEAAAREQTVKALADERLLRSAVTSEATKAGFADPEDAWAFIDKSKLTIEGETVKGTKELVDALLKAKPHLKGGTQRTIPNINAVNGGDGKRSDAEVMDEAAQIIRIPFYRPRSK